MLKANNPWPRAAFASRAPGLERTAFFGAAGLEKRPQFIVWRPKADIEAMVGKRIDAFDVKPGDRLALPPAGRVRIR